MDKDHRRLNSIVDDRETLARIRAALASMTMLNALSNLLTAMPDLPSILYEILDATIKLQGADFGDVQLYDEATGTLKIVSHRGLDQLGSSIIS
jgi:GAF domain-containing protein